MAALCRTLVPSPIARWQHFAEHQIRLKKFARTAEMDVPDVNRKERFSLLLLDPGEIYFEDFSVNYYPSNVSEDEAIKRTRRGRLKLCSKSIVFDPKDLSFPILKFPLKECSKLEQWTGPLLSRIGANRNILVIESGQAVEMLENNAITPFVFKREKQKFLFALNYAKIEHCLPQIMQLQRASTLPAADQAAMIYAIVLSRQRMVKFDTCWIEDLHESTIFETTANHITPLVTNPGRVLLTSLRLYFQPYNNVESIPVFKIKLSDIKRITKKRYLLRHVGLEIYCHESAPKSRLFLAMKCSAERETLYDSLMSQRALQLENEAQENMLILWQNGVISNYDYLLYLNSMADRSFNDLTQYPVFPWIISNYTDRELDLTDPRVFRDLSKPIGALNEERFQKLKIRYEEMPEPRFLYGSHYSTPGFVLYYLVRKVPLYMLCLHNGRFDQPDRMFNSIADTWKNVTTNTADFKELTPEFYQPENNGDFLVNTMNLHFGTRQDGTVVDNVGLPAWAKDPGDCISKLREALESQYVSQNLHHWIDLIFGYKQKGDEAQLANNVFYYLTYEGAIDLDSIADLNERHSLEVQITEFGQVPRRIFGVPHPQKSVAVDLMKEARYLCSTSSNPHDWDAEPSLDKQRKISENKSVQKFKLVHEKKIHKCLVSGMCLSFDGETLFTVSNDLMLKVITLKDQRQLRSVCISNMALSCCVLMQDGKSVIVGSWDNCVYMYSVEYGKVLEMTVAHDDAVTDIFWNKGVLATASWDSTAKVWSYPARCGLKSQSPVQLLAELDHDTKVSCVCLSSDNGRLFSGTTDGFVYLWDLASYTIDHKIAINEGFSINGLAISPDDQRVIACGKCLTVMDLQTATKIFVKNVGVELTCVQWNGQLAAVGSKDGMLRIWDFVDARLIDSLAGHTGSISSVTLSGDGKTMVTGDENGSVNVWR